MHKEDSRVGLAADGRVQQVQEHGTQAALQTTREGNVRAQEVQPRQQEGPRSGEKDLTFVSNYFVKRKIIISTFK